MNLLPSAKIFRPLWFFSGFRTPVLYSGSLSKPCDFCWAFPLDLILFQVFKISTSLFAIEPWCNFKQIMVVQLFWGKIFYLFGKQYFIHKLFLCLIYQFKMILLYHDLLFSKHLSIVVFPLGSTLEILHVEWAGWKVRVYFYLIWLGKLYMPNVLESVYQSLPLYLQKYVGSRTLGSPLWSFI